VTLKIVVKLQLTHPRRVPHGWSRFKSVIFQQYFIIYISEMVQHRDVVSGY